MASDALSHCQKSQVNSRAEHEYSGISQGRVSLIQYSAEVILQVSDPSLCVWMGNFSTEPNCYSSGLWSGQMDSRGDPPPNGWFILWSCNQWFSLSITINTWHVMNDSPQSQSLLDRYSLNVVISCLTRLLDHMSSGKKQMEIFNLITHLTSREWILLTTLKTLIAMNNKMLIHLKRSPCLSNWLRIDLFL